jgi:hypothetical protein
VNKNHTSTPETLAKIELILRESTNKIYVFGMQYRRSVGLIIDPYRLNLSDPHLLSTVNLLKKKIQHSQSNDPAFPILAIQILGHLRHVTLSFSMANSLYPSFALNAPCPKEPTHLQIERAQLFLRALDGYEIEPTPFGSPNPHLCKLLIEQQGAIDTAILADPLSSYAQLHNRLVEKGLSALFPEFIPTVKYLVEIILNADSVHEACMSSSLLLAQREDALTRLIKLRFTEDGSHKTPTYIASIRAIENAVAFLDNVTRILNASPPLYHSHKFEYYLHYLVGQPDHILFPTIASKTIEDLILSRSVPIGFIGIKDEISWVDGHDQTPYEYFFHDIDHFRRRYQYLIEVAARSDMSCDEYYAESNSLITRLLAKIQVLPADDEYSRAVKAVAKILLFEVVHENALPVDEEILVAALLRQPGTPTPFERLTDNDVVEYFFEPSPSSLTSTFRKLNHSFYDLPNKRSATLGGPQMRSREIVVAAACLLSEVLPSIGHNPGELRSIFRQRVSNDFGLPDGFRQMVVADIRAFPTLSNFPTIS